MSNESNHPQDLRQRVRELIHGELSFYLGSGGLAVELGEDTSEADVERAYVEARRILDGIGDLERLRAFHDRALSIVARVTQGVSTDESSILYCCFAECDGRLSEDWDGSSPEGHKPDCPVMRAKSLLEGEEK